MLILHRLFVAFLICLPLFSTLQIDVEAAQPAMSEASKEFKVMPLTPEDKDRIFKILKPLESEWIPKEELAKYPGLYWQDDEQKQSFRIFSQQNGLQDVYFVPIRADFEKGTKGSAPWEQCVSLLIIDRKDSDIRVLPTHPAMTWFVSEISCVAFRDVRTDGERAIIVDVKAVSPGSPHDPFNVFAVYLPTKDGSWILDSKLQSRLEQCGSLAQALKITAQYFSKK